jgi:hypothetical protein
MNVCEISKKMKCMRKYIVLQIYIIYIYIYIRVILINGLYIYRTNLIMIMILHYYFKLISDIHFYMENDFLRIRVVIIIINIFVSVIFTNLVLLHDCNYAVVEEIFGGETSKYLYTY